MKKLPLTLWNTCGVSVFHSASLNLLLYTASSQTTRITASCLETNSVTKKMLCKDGKQKNHAMVTGSHNKVFLYTPMCSNYPQTTPRCHSLLCHLEMLAWKVKFAPSNPGRHLRGAETDAVELRCEVWYQIRPLFKVLQGPELELT